MGKAGSLLVPTVTHGAWWLSSASAALVLVLAGGLVQAQDMAKTNRPAAMGVNVQPMGHVRKQADRTWIVLEPQYQPGLLGLEGFSHIHVLWWFHLNDTPEKRATLQVHPRGNPQNPLTGVFATRSPARPNLIGLTLCRIVAIRPLEVEVAEIDAIDGTPVLDIKPFIPSFDTASEVREPGWLNTKLKMNRDEPTVGPKPSLRQQRDHTSPPPNE